jgi:hypothetical protein
MLEIKTEKDLAAASFSTSGNEMKGVLEECNTFKNRYEVDTGE